MITCRKYDDVGPYLLQYYEVRCGKRYVGPQGGGGTYGWRFYTCNTGHAYIAYSYGDHHPLSIAVFNEAIRQSMSFRMPDFYFVNTSRYSVTTSKHASLVARWMTSSLRRMAIPCPGHLMQPLAETLREFNPADRAVADIVAEYQWRIEEDRRETLHNAERVRLEARANSTMSRIQKLRQKENSHAQLVHEHSYV